MIIGLKCLPFGLRTPLIDEWVQIVHTDRPNVQS